jgi:hypothetical protein
MSTFYALWGMIFPMVMRVASRSIKRWRMNGLLDARNMGCHPMLQEKFIGTRYKVDGIHATGLIALRSNTKTKEEEGK